MHTNYSDGTGTVEELARAAKQAGLQWIIITDHDDLRAAPAAGWLHDVLVIVGHEITPDRNHFLALNINEVIDNTLSPQQFVDQVYERGGFGIIAHPMSKLLTISRTSTAGTIGT
jgi:predicted metal-dependent phosphoesterase TrpH